MLTIVDLGMGNLRSVENALKKVAPDQTIKISSNEQHIYDAERVVLPGQGAIGTWFQAFRKLSLSAALEDAIKNKPLLGICIGQQAMFEHCDEDGGVTGLGLFKGQVRHFKQFHSRSANLKTPQIGWNQVNQKQAHPLWKGIPDQTWFYFVHSFCANAENAADIYGETDYGHNFTAAVGKKNIFAVQFHPEKSQHAGLQLLNNFTQWDGTV